MCFSLSNLIIIERNSPVKLLRWIFHLRLQSIKLKKFQIFYHFNNIELQKYVFEQLC